MRSPINWAVLGLLIERTGYGYDLFQRFERTYAELLGLSSPSQIYKGLDALEDRGLIEKLPPESALGEELRQPKLHYRASAEGLRAYQDWLIAQVTQQRQRSQLFELQLAGLARLDARAALVVLEHYERTYLEQPATPPDDPSLGGASALARRLIDERARLAAGTTLKWIAYARRELEAAISAQDLPR